MTLAITDRSRLRRLHERGHFDRPTINSILDAQPQCCVGYVIDGRPYVTPTLQWREGDHVYWHGSSASRAIRASKGAEAMFRSTPTAFTASSTTASRLRPRRC